MNTFMTPACNSLKKFVLFISSNKKILWVQQTLKIVPTSEIRGFIKLDSINGEKIQKSGCEAKCSSNTFPTFTHPFYTHSSDHSLPINFG